MAARVQYCTSKVYYLVFLFRDALIFKDQEEYSDREKFRP